MFGEKCLQTTVKNASIHTSLNRYAQATNDIFGFNAVNNKTKSVQ